MLNKNWNLGLTLAIAIGLSLVAAPTWAVKAKAVAADPKPITAKPGASTAEPTASPATPIVSPAEPKASPTTPTPITVQPSKQPSMKLQPVRPSAGQARETLRKLGPPPTAVQQGPRSMTYKPTIESVVFQAADGGAFTMGDGILAPRGRVVLRGRGFGPKKAAVLIDGLPNGYVVLENLQWTNTEIRGTMPAKVKGSFGVRYPVTAQVVMPELAGLSNAYPLQFENPSETKMLSGMSTAVMPRCGRDGNANQCNAYKTKGDSCVASGDAYVAPPGGTAIYGFHSNCWGASGNDAGVDSYDIKLLNGWIIHEIVEVKAQKSSSDERVILPSLSTGRATASVAVNWTATPGDHVRYWYKVKVIGPLGTDYGDGVHFGGSAGGGAIGSSYDPSNPTGRRTGSPSGVVSP